MPKIIKPLNDKQIDKAKPLDKQYKLLDGDGLQLIVFPTGTKCWRLDYTFNKKRATISLGSYPEVSLKEARDLKTYYKQQIAKGIKPNSVKESTKEVPTLKELAHTYFETRETLSPEYKADCLHKLDKDIFYKLGDNNIDTITTIDLVQLLQKVDKRANEVAKKLFRMLNSIYKYTITIGLVDRNPLADIDTKIVFRAVEYTNFKHTTSVEELKNILLTINQYKGHYTTRIALQILPYLFVRPYPLRFMEWEEINFENKLWNIPSHKMKLSKPHIVPLSDTVLSKIKSIEAYKVNQYVFHSQTTNKPFSENTFNYAFKRMGFDVTAHGFRHTASTILHENIHIHKILSDVIEMQLAHKIPGVKGVYNKALYLPERIKLMNWYSDYLDELMSK